MNQDTHGLLTTINEALFSLLKFNIPPLIEAPEDADPDLRQLCELCNTLICKLAEAKEFIGVLSNGNLDPDPPRKNFLISPLKQLHANLRHLQWQTLQVAKGDLNQQVDFLGEFSVAFNSMITSLKEKKEIEEELRTSKEELFEEHQKLKETQSQILQSEKMASIGQLAAGVAHEINNPLGFISSNIGTLNKYVQKLAEFIDAQAAVVETLSSPADQEELKTLRKSLKIDFLLEDTKDLISESLEGSERVKGIVKNLKSFSNIDQSDCLPADINECIETTLNVVWNSIKHKATVEKEYGKLPLFTCYPQQLNQLFLNLLLNAGQAIEKEGIIRIKTWADDEAINISISDTGIGMPENILARIFEPFFTTRDVGKGTGLGLSISYDIVKNHHGDICAESKVGEGTTFSIKLPLNQELDKTT